MPRRRTTVRPQLEALEDRTVPSGGMVGDLVIIGDSLSDTGNVALATGGAIPDPGLYYQGRFSNGPLWVDTLAKYLGEAAIQPSLAGGLDYSFGGATVAYLDQPPPFNAFPTLSQQVGQYLAGHTPAANDLIVVWGGANDFFFSFASPTGPINPILSSDTLLSSLETLANAGARQFVVPNLPPLGETPFIRGLGIPGLSAAANQWTAAFDAELAADVANFQLGHPGATVVSVDVAGLFQQATQPSNPFGFVNTTDAVGPLVPGSVFLSAVTATAPQDYLFFDGIHPTSKGHQLVGVEAAAGVYDALGVHHLVVTSTADTVDPTASGLSLREMVNLSNAMDGQQTITFDLGRGPHQISLSGKDLAITQDLTIRGPAAKRLAVSGNDASRIFRIDSGVSVGIDDLTITRGRADNGGGIWNAGGSLSLTGVVVSGNQAVGAPGSAARGGGIFNEGGTLTVTRSTFSDNVAQGGQRLGASVTNGIGGGIASQGVGAAVIISKSTFSANRALGGAGAPGFAGSPGAGGGMDSRLGSTLTVSRSAFTGNQAIGGAGATGGVGSTGGTGLGGGLATRDATTTIEHTTFSDNQAVGGVGGPGRLGGDSQGGGIHNTALAANATVVFSHGSLIGNLAAGGAGGAGAAGGTAFGGGLFANQAIGFVVSLDVTHTTLSHNQALGGAGGVVPGGLGSEGTGGGIAIFGASILTVSHSTVADNQAMGGAGRTGTNGGVSLGGGISIRSNLGGSPTAVVSHSMVSGNRATGGAGGTGANGGSARGGGIRNQGVTFDTSLSVSHSSIIDNAATGGAGGAGGNGGSAFGGGILNETFFGAQALLNVSHSLLAGNQAVGGQGGAGGIGGNGFGGGLYVGGGTVCIEHSRITANRAIGGAAGTGGSAGEGVGGGIYIAAGTVCVDQKTKIINNHASTSDDDVFGVFTVCP